MTDEMKNKYKTFITKISEILGLGKPVDILKLCETTDLFFRPLEKRIEELEAQVEKMKCCGNCRYSNQETVYSIVCKVGGVDKTDYIYTDDNQVCDKWEMGIKEIKENDSGSRM